MTRWAQPASRVRQPSVTNASLVKASRSGTQALATLSIFLPGGRLPVERAKVAASTDRPRIMAKVTHDGGDRWVRVHND
jgi:hypothetical protein